MKTTRLAIAVAGCVLGVGFLMLYRGASDTRTQGPVSELPRSEGESLATPDEGPELQRNVPAQPRRIPLSVTETDTDGVNADERPGMLDGLNAREGTIHEDLALVDHLLSTYYSVYQEFPWGDNADLVAAFAGQNRRQISFIESEQIPLDASGRLLDRFGKPFFFHRIAGDRIEIRSGGPDGQMWTEDDYSSLDAAVAGERSPSVVNSAFARDPLASTSW